MHSIVWNSTLPGEICARRKCSLVIAFHEAEKASYCRYCNWPRDSDIARDLETILCALVEQIPPETFEYVTEGKRMLVGYAGIEAEILLRVCDDLFSTKVEVHIRKREKQIIRRGARWIMQTVPWMWRFFLRRRTCRMIERTRHALDSLSLVAK